MRGVCMLLLLALLAACAGRQDAPPEVSIRGSVETGYESVWRR